MATHCPSSTNCSNSTSSSGFTFQSTEEAHDLLINFKGGPVQDIFDVHSVNGPLLHFQQHEIHNVNHELLISPSHIDDGQESDYSSLIGNYHWNQIDPKFGSLDTHALQDLNYFQTTTELNSVTSSNNKGSHKRPNMGESMQAMKKQYNNATKKTRQNNKSSTTPPSKDPQSIAAKNRRERISDRLKILQELVPNGSKVDLVTMLEKAISYVKFLQVQVKVLASDEFWPAQGGKAPDITQVKEAIDAILASQREEFQFKL